MTAIQRWFFLQYDDQPYKATPGRTATDELWCKAADVAQLELLLKRYLEDLATSRQSRDRAKADLAIADEKIMFLEGTLTDSEVKMDQLLQHCSDGECYVCAYIICPHKDTMHFHHDGCPSCAANNEEPV